MMAALAVCACSCGSTEPVAASAEDATRPAGALTGAAALAAAAGVKAAPSVDVETAASAPAETLDARFVPMMEKAFAEYKPWGRWDDEMRWAPGLCRMPLPGQARMSAAEDGGHARKLYSIFVKERGSYSVSSGLKGKSQPVGQTLIKESYLPEPVAQVDPAEVVSQEVPLGGTDDHFDRYARVGEQLYRAGAFAGVYVMAKLPAGTDGTDAGWVYGTVTASGQVTSAGRVASCMGCHLDATSDRLFGIGPKGRSPVE